ncbi:aldehyde dehydrogenase family protein [Nocardia sp. NPDC019395]|uniref:aldehyde dehydrogenase family protein n=1 Tax=Nocardia sp. NPDC019395 TaxID=3154686 RepID=UPI003402357D
MTTGVELDQVRSDSGTENALSPELFAPGGANAPAPLVIAGLPRRTDEQIEISSPADDRDIFRCAVADPGLVAEAAAAAYAARARCAELDRGERALILENMATAIARDRDVLARVITREVGKALRDSLGEVDRAVATLRAAAHAAAGLTGREIPVDAVPSGRGRHAYTVWEPVGVVTAICGFNFPLLLAVHKLSAAIGAGCPVLLKPSDRTPLATIALAGYAVGAGWPPAAISVLNGDAAVGKALVEHPVVRLVSFTGSTAVGGAIAAAAGARLKRTVMELGSNAPTIVTADADLDLAARRCALGAMVSSGQSCISVQRVFADRSIAADLAEAMAGYAAQLRVGDPYDPETELGNVISPESAARLGSMIDDAVARGATLLTGGVRDRAVLPTVLFAPSEDAEISRDEAFGPVVAVYPFDSLDEAIDAANRLEFGLMAGVFTTSIETATAVADALEAGGVHINECSNFRADNMPYGGVKGSGYGKEGPASAIREMSVEKVVTWPR